MNTARYVLAVILISSFPAGFGTWLLIHPFIGFWRRIGPTLTWTAVLPIVVGAGFGLFLARDVLVGIDLGTNLALLPLALLSYGVSAVIEFRCRRHLKLRILVGMPELNPEGRPTPLLTRGIYGRVRHPRYLSVMFGLLAVALFVNYVGVYVLIPVTILCLYLVVLFEERELLDRFGSEYEQYSLRVPRFIPTFGRTQGVD
jgi:protein-S-isoprenylcysteine O-methyltransferase Ste14